MATSSTMMSNCWARSTRRSRISLLTLKFLKRIIEESEKEERRERERERGKDPVSLSDQLSSVELSNHRFQDLVDYRGEDPLIEISAESTEDVWELLHLGPGQHTECDVDHLQI